MVTGRRKLEGLLCERQSRGLEAASGSPSRACNSLLPTRTTWSRRAAPAVTSVPRRLRHPSGCPGPHLHANVPGLFGGPRGEGDPDPGVSRGAQQRPLRRHQAGVGHRARNHEEPGEVGHLAVGPEPLAWAQNTRSGPAGRVSGPGPGWQVGAGLRVRARGRGRRAWVRGGGLGQGCGRGAGLRARVRGTGQGRRAGAGHRSGPALPDGPGRPHRGRLLLQAGL